MSLNVIDIRLYEREDRHNIVKPISCADPLRLSWKNNLILCVPRVNNESLLGSEMRSTSTNYCLLIINSKRKAR